MQNITEQISKIKELQLQFSTIREIPKHNKNIFYSALFSSFFLAIHMVFNSLYSNSQQYDPAGLAFAMTLYIIPTIICLIIFLSNFKHKKNAQKILKALENENENSQYLNFLTQFYSHENFNVIKQTYEKIVNSTSLLGTTETIQKNFHEVTIKLLQLKTEYEKNDPKTDLYNITSQTIYFFEKLTILTQQYNDSEEQEKSIQKSAKDIQLNLKQNEKPHYLNEIDFKKLF